MTHKWNADRPGKLPEDDGLNRVQFAKRVAKEIGSRRQRDSLVISLNGDWGSGKSTLKNLILHYLRKEKPEKGKPPLVVEFNPWQWSGQDKLLEGFFREIGAMFNSGLISDSKKAESLARFWEGLRVVSTAGVELAEKLQQSLIAAAALLAGVAGSVSTYVESPTGKAVLASGSIVLVALAGILGIYAPIAEKFGAVVAWQLKKKQLSLEAIREKLRTELSTLEATLLVVIDDMDRLTKREVRLLVQLIKANADFPNVVYLLLYQKNIVADALGEITSEKGRDFLKKIVQVELEVPAPPEYKMRELFAAGLDRILLTAQARWDKERWRRLFEDAVWPYFRTPRDIKRFIGVFEFYFEGHVSDGTLEVNPIDLILLETLRVFDPEAYDAVSRAFQKQRNVFIEIMFDDKEARSRFALGIKELIDRPQLQTSEKARLRSLLFGLFPQGSESFEKAEETEWSRDLRICDAGHFSRYFQLGGDPGDVPASVIARLLNAESSSIELNQILLIAIKEGYFLALLKQLRGALNDIHGETIKQIIIALFDVSDSLPAIKSASLIFDSDLEREIARICGLLLKQLGNSDSRVGVLRKAILASSAITGPVLTLSFLTPDGRQHDPDAWLIDNEKVSELRDLILPRIWESANSGVIWSLKAVAGILYKLRDWAGPAPVEIWLKTAMANNAQHAALFLEKMLQESQSTSDGGTKTVFYLVPTQIERFIPLSDLISHAEIAASTAFQKAAVLAGKKALVFAARGNPHHQIFVMAFDSEGNALPDKTDPFGGP